jgi:uncharacterized Zn finger protein
MLIEIKCSHCGSKDVVLDELETGEEIYYCNNPKCENCGDFGYIKDIRFKYHVKENIIIRFLRHIKIFLKRPSNSY